MKSIHGNLQRARNLYVMDVCGTSGKVLLIHTIYYIQNGHRPLASCTDPYVDMCLCSKDIVLKKWKSSIKMKTLDPIYNEPFYFNLESTDLSDISIRITFMDYDKIGRNEVIGCAIIGPASSYVSGRNQWKRMMQNPGEDCTFWHTLNIA